MSGFIEDRPIVKQAKVKGNLGNSREEIRDF